MIHRLEFAAVLFWAVVAGLFGVILVKHVRDRDFSYPYFDFQTRQQVDQKDHGASASTTLSRQGPLVVEETVYADGFRRSKVSISGTDLDAPSERIAKNLNEHIKALNEAKQEESIVLIALDALGLATAVFSAVYELARVKKAAAA